MTDNSHIDTAPADTERADRLAFYLIKGMNKTIRSYRMLLNDDHVLVAVSGGKDSLTLLDLLHRRRRSAKERIRIAACTVRSDHHCGKAVPEEWLARYCQERHIPFHSVPIHVAETLSQARKSHCFWCSYRRRTALFKLADELGCNKLAFGHHADDVAETILMNLCFSGKVSRMEPKQALFNGKLTVIRPLAMTEERDIVDLARASGYPLSGEACPDGVDSRRALVRKVLRELESDTINVKRCMYHAVERAQRALALQEASAALKNLEQISDEGMKQEEDHD